MNNIAIKPYYWWLPLIVSVAFPVLLGITLWNDNTYLPPYHGAVPSIGINLLILSTGTTGSIIFVALLSLPSLVLLYRRLFIQAVPATAISKSLLSAFISLMILQTGLAVDFAINEHNSLLGQKLLAQGSK